MKHMAKFRVKDSGRKQPGRFLHAVNIAIVIHTSCPKCPSDSYCSKNVRMHG